MKRLFTFGVLFHLFLLQKPIHSADAMVLESRTEMPGEKWACIDTSEMRPQFELTQNTIALFKNIIEEKYQPTDPTSYQKTAAEWLALAQTIGPHISCETFKKGYAENYKRCQFTNTPPLYLCLALKSPAQLQELSTVASPSTTICEAIQQFEAKKDLEGNLQYLRDTLIPLYQQLVAEKNAAPFKDFGGGEDFGMAEFKSFFASVEVLEAVQARAGTQFHPLDRFGQILRQSSVFMQSEADLKLASAAEQGKEQFDALLKEQRMLWNAAQIVPETPRQLGDILNQLSSNITSGELDNNPDLAQAGLDLLQKGKKPSFSVTDRMYDVLPALGLFGQ